MACNTGEVLVGAEQLEARRDARLGDDAVDRPAHGDASVPQPTIETGGLDMPVNVERQERKPEQHIPRLREVAIGTKTCKTSVRTTGTKPASCRSMAWPRRPT